MQNGNESLQGITRRHLLRQVGCGIGAAAVTSMLGHDRMAGNFGRAESRALAAGPPPFAPRAKSVIFLFMAGGPSQLELFDYKPKLVQFSGQDCPEEEWIRNERFACMTDRPKLLGTQRKFARHGQSRQEISDLLPHLATIADDIAIVRTVHTPQFNHAPAQIFMNTGYQLMGRPSMGSWLTHGLGSGNKYLPGFVVLHSGRQHLDGGKSCWSAGFLPTGCEGVEFRNVPHMIDIAREPRQVHDMYGTEPGIPSFAGNCLLARRLVQRGVRCVQLCHRGWDTHGTHAGDSITHSLPRVCRQVDQPAVALVNDLKQRGLLDQTLVIWGGEFGRSPIHEERGGSKFLGRDHHPNCFSLWMAGGGIKPGITHGQNDDLGFQIIEDAVSVHDLHATVLHLMGIDHKRLTYKFHGRDFGLTNASGNVVTKLLA